MKTYTIHLKYSTNNGKSWTGTTITVKAESDISAMMQAESKYPMVKEVKIKSKR